MLHQTEEDVGPDHGTHFLDGGQFGPVPGEVIQHPAPFELLVRILRLNLERSTERK